MVSTITSPTVDPDALTNKVRSALGLPSFRIDEWNCASLTGHVSNPATRGLYRLTGNGRQDAQSIPWSLILKILQLTDDAPQGWGTDLLHFGYWKREALAYESGIVQDLGGDLRAPHCFGAAEQTDGSVWLWLEEIVETGPSLWSLPRYGLAARHFGQWQGAYLAGRPLPPASWLQTGWLRSWVAHFDFLQNYLPLPDFWEHPLVRAAFPDPVAKRLLEMWAQRREWMEILDRMPRTLCHFDTWRPNLLAEVGPDGQEQTVALDWQGMGLGPAGEVGNLLLTSLMTLEVKPAEAKALDAAIWEGYLQGLRETGWNGNPAEVRFCYTAYPALRWGLVFPMLMIAPYVLDPGKRAEAEARYGQPIEALLRQWAEVVYVLLDFAEEARGLACSLRAEAA
jgi:hypothetical protein